MGANHLLTTVAELEAVYGQPMERALIKEVGTLIPPYRAYIEASPFLIIATSGPGGLDCSPKGDAPGFVRILDEETLVIPDRPGNNRIDGFRNIVEDPRVALIFIVPGAGETLRVNGRASISVDPQLLAASAVNGRQPRSVTIVKVESVFLHCSKALVRSKLWDSSRHVGPGAVPSFGEVFDCITEGEIDAADYDRSMPERIAKTLY
jgi:uncharacterized protein